MRSTVLALLLGPVIGAGGALAGAGAATAAAQPTSVRLPLTTVADVVSTGDRVFISGGRRSTDVVVTDAAGAVVTTLTGLPGPTELQLSNNRRTLYVALSSGRAIAAFDTVSLRESARYDTGAAECPESLALTGRYLWFGYGCGGGDGEIGRFDLGRRPATVATGLAGVRFSSAPLVTSALRNPRVLLAGEAGGSTASVQAYTIGAGGTLADRRTNASDDSGSNLGDIALDPAGETAYTAAGSPYAVLGLSAADLTPRTRYVTGPYPNAVEVSRDGTRVAAGILGLHGPDVHVFASDGTGQLHFELGDALLPGALAWAPNGRRLYAVDEGANLHVLPVPPPVTPRPPSPGVTPTERPTPRPTVTSPSPSPTATDPSQPAPPLPEPPSPPAPQVPIGPAMPPVPSGTVPGGMPPGSESPAP